MKKRIVFVAVLSGLIVSLSLIGCIDFNRSDDVPSSQTDNDISTSPGKTEPSAEIQPVVERKTGIEPDNETKNIIIAEKSRIPFAVPVATPEEAEKANLSAREIYKLGDAARNLKAEGFSNVLSDTLESFVRPAFSDKHIETLQKNGVSLTKSDLMQRKIPRNWTIDWNTLKGKCDFTEEEEGFRICSSVDFLRLYAPPCNISNTKTAIVFDITPQTKETTINLGFQEHGMFKPGRAIKKTISGVCKRECVSISLSAMEHFDSIHPILEIQGEAVIHGISFFQKTYEEATTLEGTIVERSDLPDPKKSDYPNCRFSVHFEGNSILSGKPCPKEILFLLDGFQNFQVLNTNNIKEGDRILCTIVPFDHLPEEEQLTQQVDDLDLFLLDRYYVLGMRKIESFSGTPTMPLSGIFFLEEQEDYISIFDRGINPPIPENIREAQAKAIHDDLEKMNKLLDGYNESRINKLNRQFAETWQKEKDKDPPGYNRIGQCVWRNIDNSFWALPNDYTFLAEPELLNDYTLDCFAALKKACESNGVQLIVSLVPQMYVISSRVINRDYSNIPDIQTATFVKQLSELGIETIYSSDKIIENYNRFPFAFFFPEDNHPADTTQDCISDIIVERLKRYNIPVDLDPELFTATMGNTRTYHALQTSFPEDCDIGSYNIWDTYECQHIYYDNSLVKKDQNAFLIIVGNSFIVSPMASFPDALPTLVMYKSLLSADWYSWGGSGPFSDFLTQILSFPNLYMKDKKVLIMQVGTVHLQSVAQQESMFNIASLDEERLLLNNKRMIIHHMLSSIGLESMAANTELWGPLSNIPKTVLQLSEKGDYSCNICIDELDSDHIIKKSEPLVISIPHTCTSNVNCKIIVNDISKTMQSSNALRNTRFYNLTFELPAGTNELNMRIEGKPGSLIAIKDIQIWQ